MDISNSEAPPTSRQQNVRPALVRVFLCHSSKDKPAVFDVAKELLRNQVSPFLDRWELQPGASLIEKISTAIVQDCDFVIAFISRESVRSPWVRKELSLAVNREIAMGRAFLIPLVLDDCEIPHSLSDKLYLRIDDPEWKPRLMTALGLAMEQPPEIRYLWNVVQWERSGVLPEDEFLGSFGAELGPLAEETNTQEFLFRTMVRNYSPKRPHLGTIFTEEQLMRLGDQLLADRALDAFQRFKIKSDAESVIRQVYDSAQARRSWQLAFWLAEQLRRDRRPVVRHAVIESLVWLGRRWMPILDASEQQAAGKLAELLLQATKELPELVASERLQDQQLPKLFGLIGLFGQDEPDLLQAVCDLPETKFGVYPLYSLTYWPGPETEALLLCRLRECADESTFRILARLVSGQITGRLVAGAVAVLDGQADRSWTPQGHRLRVKAIDVLRSRLAKSSSRS